MKYNTFPQIPHSNVLDIYEVGRDNSCLVFALTEALLRLQKKKNTDRGWDELNWCA